MSRLSTVQQAGILVGLLIVISLFSKSMDLGQTILGIIVVGLYMLPALVAGQRHHRQKLAITVLNVLAGWTVIGWLVALIWACTADVEWGMS
jgi:hypothetical protein